MSLRGAPVPAVAAHGCAPSGLGTMGSMPSFAALSLNVKSTEALDAPRPPSGRRRTLTRERGYQPPPPLPLPPPGTTLDPARDQSSGVYYDAPETPPAPKPARKPRGITKEQMERIRVNVRNRALEGKLEKCEMDVQKLRRALQQQAQVSKMPDTIQHPDLEFWISTRRKDPSAIYQRMFDQLDVQVLTSTSGAGNDDLWATGVSAMYPNYWLKFMELDVPGEPEQAYLIYAMRAADDNELLQIQAFLRQQLTRDLTSQDAPSQGAPSQGAPRQDAPSQGISTDFQTPSRLTAEELLNYEVIWWDGPPNQDGGEAYAITNVYPTEWLFVVYSPAESEFLVHRVPATPAMQALIEDRLMQAYPAPYETYEDEELDRSPASSTPSTPESARSLKEPTTPSTPPTPAYRDFPASPPASVPSTPKGVAVVNSRPDPPTGPLAISTDPVNPAVLEVAPDAPYAALKIVYLNDDPGTGAGGWHVGVSPYFRGYGLHVHQFIGSNGQVYAHVYAAPLTDAQRGEYRTKALNMQSQQGQYGPSVRR